MSFNVTTNDSVATDRADTVNYQSNEQNKVDYQELVARQARSTEIDTARVRGWGYFLGSYLTGPVYPAIIANRTKKWGPFWAGLALGTISLPFAAMDLGILSSLPAAALGTALMADKSRESRARLQIINPEEADLLRFKEMGL